MLIFISGIIAGYRVVWRVCVDIFKWEKSYQQYLQTSNLRVREIPAAEVDSQSSSSGENSISRAANFGWTMAKF